jgi:hypothetical protein
MRTTRYIKHTNHGRQEVTVVRIYESAMMKGREFEKHAKIVSQRGSIELARDYLATAQSLFNAAQTIRPLVRIADAEFKIQSYQQAIDDIKLLIQCSQSSQNVILKMQIDGINERIQSLNSFLQKMQEGLTKQQIAQMQQLSHELWNRIKGL